MPRGNRTRSPSTSAPAAAYSVQRVGIVAHDHADLFEDRVGVVLDDARGPRRSPPRTAASVRVRNGDASMCVASRAAWRPAPPSRSTARGGSRRHEAPPSPGRTRPAARRAATSAAPRWRPATVVGVGKPHRADEVRLERGLDRGLDLHDLARDPGDLGAGGLREERAHRAAPGRVADVASDRRGRSRG